MRNTHDIIETALSFTADSLAETIPYDIDESITGGRIIVEFSTYNYETSLIKAEILDSDWEKDISLSRIFKERIEDMIQFRNKETKLSIQQALEIKKDQMEMF